MQKYEEDLNFDSSLSLKLRYSDLRSKPDERYYFAAANSESRSVDSGSSSITILASSLETSSVICASLLGILWTNLNSPSLLSVLLILYLSLYLFNICYLMLSSLL